MRTSVAPMPDIPKTLPPEPVSFEAFLEWMDEDTHAEWVDGQIVMTSPASAVHESIRDFLLSVMGMSIETCRTGWLCGGFLMKLDVRPSGREPDILFLTNEHLDRLGTTYIAGPADLAVEIVSPESDARDRGEKFVEYEAAGIPEYLLLDPIRQEAIFYQLGMDGRYHPGPIDTAGVYHSQVLKGFWLNVAWLWQQPMPNVPAIAMQIGGIDQARALLAAMRQVLGQDEVMRLLREGETIE